MLFNAPRSWQGYAWPNITTFVIIRQRSLPLRALHKHRNRYPDTLIDVDHENFFLIAKENRDAAATARTCTSTTGLFMLRVQVTMWLPATEFCGPARSSHATRYQPRALGPALRYQCASPVPDGAAPRQKLSRSGHPGSIVNILSMATHCGQSYLTAYSAPRGCLRHSRRTCQRVHRPNASVAGWPDHRRAGLRKVNIGPIF